MSVHSKPDSERDAILITAVGRQSFDAALDLLSSVDAVNPKRSTAIGAIDLGLGGAQRRALIARGVTIATPPWPLRAPAGQQRVGHLAQVIRPFSNLVFPGYRHYLWLDADRRLRSPECWRTLIAAADRDGLAVPVQSRPADPTVPWPERQWLIQRLDRAYGIRKMLSLTSLPMVDPGIVALRGDAPQWPSWQAETRRLVERTRSVAAADRIALLHLVYVDEMPANLLEARHGRIGSRANTTPASRPRSRSAAELSVV
ncbi:MAG: hypothetical protein R3E87_04065 [Burkholderiaceae bacterium]